MVLHLQGNARPGSVQATQPSHAQAHPVPSVATHPPDEPDNRVHLPFTPGHYQFTFTTPAKLIRRIYQGDDMYALYDLAKAQAEHDYPDSRYHVMHSPQCD
jgi:hypothetical protein